MCQNCNSVEKLSFHKDIVLEILKEDKSFKNGDYHQSLLNICYDEWQKNKNWSYSDMINFAIENYGELVAFAVLIGKYNQQVCNGGHAQYYYNGYASGSGGFGSNHGDDTSMHDLLLSYFMRDSDLKKYSWYEILNNLLNQFLDFSIDDERYTIETCNECGGRGEEDEDTGEEDEDGDTIYETVKCSYCGGSGEEEVCSDSYGEPVGHSWDRLDTKYYEITDEVEKNLNVYFKSKLV